MFNLVHDATLLTAVQPLPPEQFTANAFVCAPRPILLSTGSLELPLRVHSKKSCQQRAPQGSGRLLGRVRIPSNLVSDAEANRVCVDVLFAVPPVLRRFLPS